MKLKRNKADAESRAYWEFVEETAKEVRSWPEWMKGGETEPEPKAEDNDADSPRNVKATK
jgi:hypothetical protein